MSLVFLLAALGVLCLALEWAVLARRLQRAQRATRSRQIELAYWRRQHDLARRRLAWVRLLASTRPVWSRRKV